MILGMNLLVFILLAWVAIVAIAWSCEYGGEIYHEQKDALEKKYPWMVSDSEMTAEVPLPYDPDKTITITKVEYEIQTVFVIDKRTARVHRRHART